ncbi:peptidase M16 [Neiella marina]|uniref:Protease 3 n=1 Tax=Neiella marina TaxID=508461 RepID=A0A8J2UB07_9GAMM|nr:insulinase family protein [Neiella marina]GGA90456.1 peptidase M16 [Neiella marina]
MLKSPQDHRQYQPLTLPNGLRVLLVADHKSEQAAAAMTVNVGQFDDPDDRPGMAHFLEHMLFLGTEGYPVAGEYGEFIQRHGGNHNAWTGTEQTGFFFDCRPEAYEQALDRFSQFFTCPTFNSECVDKERQAIESEYQMKVNDDTRRIYQVHKETVNPEHPFSRFSVGNLSTLHNEADSLRDEVMAFYRQQYDARRMTLVLLAPQSLEQLEQWARQLFTSVQSGNAKDRPVLAPLYLPENLGIQIDVVPIRNMRRVLLTFPMPESARCYLTKPIALLSHLIGYEGPNSLYADLKHQGLINTLSAGGGIRGSNYHDFNISLNLTEKGWDNQDHIVRAIFDLVELIKLQGIEEWRYQEKQNLMQQAFEFSEQPGALDTVSHLAQNMHKYPAEHYVFGDYAMTDFEPEIIQQALNAISPANMRLTRVHPDNDSEQVADWYHTPYRVRPFNADQRKLWLQPAMVDVEWQLPPNNPFIQTKLKPRRQDREKSQPKLLVKLDGLKMWHGQSKRFHQPKGHLYIASDSPMVDAEPRHRAWTKLYVDMLYDELSEITYQAEIAGIGYELFAHSTGVSLHLGGFTGRQSFLLELIFERFRQPELSEQRFEEIRYQLLRNIKNQANSGPLNRLFAALSNLIQPASLTPDLMAQHIADTEYEDIVEFAVQWRKKIALEILAYGDYTEWEARSLAGQMASRVFQEGEPYDIPEKQIISLEGMGQVDYQIDNQHQDSAVVVYYQSAFATPYRMALFALTNQLMSATFFNELRTRQQLGYSVGTGYMPLSSFPGLLFYVQSNVASPSTILAVIDDFIQQFPLVLLELSEQSWQQTKASLMAQIMDKDGSLQEKSKRFWVSISNGDIEFNQRERILAELQRIERTDVLKFIVEQLKASGSDRLVLHALGQSHRHLEQQEESVQFESIDEFQTNAKKLRVTRPT